MTQSIENLPGMVGRHPLMLALYARVRRLAVQDTSVLLVGETGTGKELVALALHRLSRRWRRGLVALNCAAIPDGLAEAELFGVEAGAYTGATCRRPGTLARAHRSTLFLDEIDSASLSLQVKLLRASESHEFTRLGSGRVERSDFRLLAATSRPPQALLASGTLREDLYYRLSCVLSLPPLRERPEDILPLARHFLLAFNGNGRPKALEPCAERVLQAYAWPGNVRELRRTIEALVTFVEEPTVTAADVEREVGLQGGERRVSESERLRAALEAHEWNARATARSLGCGRTTLYRRMARCRIQRPGTERTDGIPHGAAECSGGVPPGTR